MKKETYIAEVIKHLDMYSDSIVKNFVEVITNLPTKTVRTDIYVFTDQDGEGFLSFHISLNGPDLYVLNKEIRDKATIFDIKMTSNGLDPPFPLLDPFDIDFPSSDVLVDTASIWLKNKLKNID